MISGDEVPHRVRTLATNANNGALSRIQFQRNRGAKTEYYPIAAAGLYRKIQLQGWECPYCGNKISLTYCHVDHIYPIGKKGIHCLGNVIISCVSCNLDKHDHDLKDWLGRKRYLEIMKFFDDINDQLEMEGYNPWNYANDNETPIDDS